MQRMRSRNLAVGVIGGLTLMSTVAARYPTEADRAQPLQVITFGSCNRVSHDQWHWSAIREAGTELFIWAGDNVYGKDGDPDDLQAKFAAQKARDDYAAFAEATPIIGTWDDHDFGINNAGKEHPYKDQAQQWLLDFLDEPADSPRRESPGVYAAYRFGKAPREVRVVLLDARYHRDPPGEDSDILGEAQWAWLEAELAQPAPALTLIVSGIQVIPVDQPFEKWANHGGSRERLLGLLREHAVPGVVLLSGDRHTAEISLLQTDETPYPLLELTSSSLTHAWKGRTQDTNRYRVGPLVTDNNFGIVAVDWDAPQPLLSLAIETENGERPAALSLPLDLLRPTKDLDFDDPFRDRN